ncbi:MAG: hypothetical protein HNEKOMLI_00003 [Sodalis sp. Psp]|nr:hypothetical protein [Sodalis sp. Psp]MCR3756511.1 hypothetical protein [Sodalis sp. Ppy]
MIILPELALKSNLMDYFLMGVVRLRLAYARGR